MQYISGVKRIIDSRFSNKAVNLRPLPDRAMLTRACACSNCPVKHVIANGERAPDCRRSKKSIPATRASFSGRPLSVGSASQTKDWSPSPHGCEAFKASSVVALIAARASKTVHLVGERSAAAAAFMSPANAWLMDSSALEGGAREAAGRGGWRCSAAERETDRRFNGFTRIVVPRSESDGADGSRTWTVYLPSLKPPSMHPRQPLYLWAAAACRP
mmetsp:Transcript_73507/g.148048  ORF Transcript_73507/g.148048 Transcript_73507/m.148048 type:complete len:216 (+) Transcript_73507:1133-1780(+)